MRTLYKSHGTKEAKDSAPGPSPSEPASRIPWLSAQLGGLDPFLLDLRFLNIRQKQNLGFQGMNIASQTLRISSEDIWSGLYCAPPTKELPPGNCQWQLIWKRVFADEIIGVGGPEEETQRRPREDRGRPWRDVATS